MAYPGSASRLLEMLPSESGLPGRTSSSNHWSEPWHVLKMNIPEQTAVTSKVTSLYKPHYQFERSSSMLTNGSNDHSHFGATMEDTHDDISTNQNGDLLNGYLTDRDVSRENVKRDGHVLYNCFVTHENGLGFTGHEDNRYMDSTNRYGGHSTTGEAAYGGQATGQDGTCLGWSERLENSCHPLPHKNHLPLPENQIRTFQSPMQNQSMNLLFQSHEHQEMGPYAAVTNFNYPQHSDHVLDPSEFENIPEDIFDLIEDYLPKDCLINLQPCLESVQINDSQATVQAQPISSSLVVGFGPQQPAEFPLAVPSIQTEPSERDESEEESEDLVQAETYTDYKPAKVHLGGLHPDSVVETSTLASVAPPDPTYEPALPSETALSGLQLEAVIYACQRHEVILPGGERGGFLIGDGAGVGKGRTAAAIIFENFLLGRRKALWLSVSNDLLYDAERDLRDVGAGHISIFSLSKFRYTERPQAEGVLFLTYAALIGESQQGTASVLGSTQAIIPRTRLEQLLQWCGQDFDGVLVLDECHKAKNLRPNGSARPSKTGCAVLKLQEKLPRARVLYASATGASEPKNMAYMTRLGLWGPGLAFGNFDAFLQSIERRGVPGMELVAVEMKQAGAYLARQLSFRGASFNVEEAILKPAARQAYNEAAHLWRDVAAMFELAATKVGDAVAPNTGWKTKSFSRKALWGQFWSAHQRFFRYLCVAAKIDRVVLLAQQALMEGKCVVVGLQATGEARTREELVFNHGQLGTFVSSARGVLKSLIEKHFPVGNNWEQPGLRKRKKHIPWRLKAGKFGDGIALESEESGSPSSTCLGLDDDDDDDDVIVIGSTPAPLIPDVSREQLESMRAKLLQRVDELVLPLNTLDELVDQLGGPQNVAEMTGRRGRVVRRPDGSVHYESRAEPGVSVETVNLTQKEYFMSGEKLVAIISEAASSGISLQADRRVSNHRRRLHLTLELPWSADRAVQQFGRTHRSNQVCAPEYIYLISELAGERRFASVVARRLESLGALTHGDRRASESRDLSQFHYDNKYGREALEKVIRSIIIGSYHIVRPPDYPGDFFEDMKEGLLGVGIITKDTRGNLTVEKELSLSKFLNRLLGLEVERQAALFTYFCSTFEIIMKAAKNAGNYDMGILDIASSTQEIHNEKQETFPRPEGVELILHTVTLDRGITWEDALRRYEELSGDLEGFYFSRPVRANRKMAVLVVKGDNLEPDENEDDDGDCLFEIYRPNTGHQKKKETQNSLQRKFYKVEPSQAKDAWIQQHTWSLHNCSHTFWSGHCRKATKNCRYGLRLRHYNVLSGGLLSVWPRIEAVLQRTTSSTAMHIVRLATRSGRKHVGIKIPDSCINPVREILLSLLSYQDTTGFAHETSCHLLTEPLYF